MSKTTPGEEISWKQTFSMKDLPCIKVVVYPDQAEVKRLIKTKLNRGQVQLVVNNVSKYFDKDSIRVEGVGDATVLDVYCETNKFRVSDEAAESNEDYKRLTNEIRDLEKNEEITNSKLERVMHLKSLLNDFASRLSKPSVPIHTAEPAQMDESTTSLSSSKDNVENFMNFLDLYTSRSEQLDEMKYQIRKDLNRIRERLDTARENLETLNESLFAPRETTDVIILVDVKNDNTELHFYVSYLVSNASWNPKYDIRVFSQDKTMIINYFGMITQYTGEDWLDSIIVLTTAVPPTRGVIPEIESTQIRVKPKETAEKSSERRPSKVKPPQPEEGLIIDATETSGKVEKTKLVSSTTFVIPHNANIPSDDKAHKVSIGVINLKPDFEYESVPRKSPNVFIRAKVKNDSNYLILPGLANVFFDNNLVAKTELETYTPQEEFWCALGVDSGIRIDYKPLRKQVGHGGLINRCTTITCTQTIEVKNTTQNNVKVIVLDNVPSSTDDKVQVKLVEPSIKGSTNVHMTKQNNIVFVLHLAPFKTEEINIKYNIENYSDQPLEFL